MNKIVLCGNPNTGKTTIYNKITQSRERVGNFHGVTVDTKVKNIKLNNITYSVVDLPGLYSLQSFTMEEEISINFLLNLKPTDTILYIVDLKKIKRNLYLFFELREMGYNIILCINRMDKNCFVNYQKLESELNQKIIVFSKNIKQDLEKNIKINNKNLIPNYFRELVNENQFLEKNFKQKYNTIKAMENGAKTPNFIDISSKNNLDYLINKRHNYIRNIIDRSDFKVNENKSIKLDNVFLNKKYSFLIFFLILSIIFLLTFGSFTNYFSNVLDKFFHNIFLIIEKFLAQNKFSLFFTKFFCEGIYLGLSIILSFLPQLFVLYVCTSILEESGYIARLSFIFDDIMEKFGLNGKSIFTFIMSFGCSTSACYQARTNQNNNSKIKLVLLSPFFSCSAKIPIYFLILNIFFSRIKLITILMIYLIGVLVSFCALVVLNKIIPSKEETMILEVPSLKLPSIKKIMFSSFRQTMEFFIKIGSFILMINCIVWIFSNCNFNLVMVSVEDSILYQIGTVLSFVFKPLGFGTPAITSALLIGTTSKELILSTLQMFGANSKIPLRDSILLPSSLIYFTKQSAVSFLIFTLLYCPCVSNFLTIKQEVGNKFAFIGAIVEFIIAYILAFLCYVLMKITNSLLITFSIIIFGLIFLMIVLNKCLKLENKK